MKFKYDVLCLRMMVCDILVHPVDRRIFDRDTTKVDNVYEIPLQTVLDALPYIDYFVPSREEAQLLTNTMDPSLMANRLMQYGCNNVIIKLGNYGCLIKNCDMEMLLPACQVENVVDTTGAGDDFVGDLRALARNTTLVEAVIFAQIMASVSIQKVGATTAVHNLQQIMELML